MLISGALADAHVFVKDGHWVAMRQDDYLSDADRIRIVDQVREQLLEITKRHFPRTTNLEYAILKGHLILEHALTQYIRCTSFVLVEPEDLRFSFSEKLEIAILHGFGNGCPTLIPSVELLNRLRNQIAHRFSLDQNLVNQLIQINSDDLNVKRLTDRQRISWLRRWCYFTCGRISGELHAWVTITSRTVTTSAVDDDLV